MHSFLRRANVVVATTGVPGHIKPEMVRRGQVILALTNPYPEIEPEDGLAAGAAFAADGKSVNNVLGYPGIFRGALLSGAEQINPEMKLAAASVIAELDAVREAAVGSGVAHPSGCLQACEPSNRERNLG